MSQSEENNEDRPLQTNEESQNGDENEENLPPPPVDDDEQSTEGRVSTPAVIYRASWGARAPRREMEELTLPVSEVLITFTGSEQCLTNHECLELVHLLQRRDMYDKGLADIQYNFLVGGDATVYEGRGLKYHADKDPEHMDLKGKSIDIAYIGDFRDAFPPKKIIQITVKLLEMLIDGGFVAGNFHLTQNSVPLKKVIRACAGMVQMLVENDWVSTEFNLTPLANSQSVWDKGDGCRGEECFQEGHEEVNWQKYPGFKSLDELLTKSLF